MLFARIHTADGHRNYRLDGVTDLDYAESAAHRLMHDMGYDPETGEDTEPEFPLVWTGSTGGAKVLRRGVNYTIESRGE